MSAAPVERTTAGHLATWGPVALWCAGIVALSHVPFSRSERVFEGDDKAFHLLEYGVLGFLMARALGGPRLAHGGWRTAIGAALLATLFGALDEFHQGFVPNREPEWMDLLADALGGAAGAGVLALAAGFAGPPTSEAHPGPIGPTSGPPDPSA